MQFIDDAEFQIAIDDDNGARITSAHSHARENQSTCVNFVGLNASLFILRMNEFAQGLRINALICQGFRQIRRLGRAAKQKDAGHG